MNTSRITLIIACLPQAGCAFVGQPPGIGEFTITILALLAIGVGAVVATLDWGTPSSRSGIDPELKMTPEQAEKLRKAWEASMENAFLRKGEAIIAPDDKPASSDSCHGCGAPLEFGTHSCSWCKRPHRRT